MAYPSITPQVSPQVATDDTKGFVKDVGHVRVRVRRWLDWISDLNLPRYISERAGMVSTKRWLNADRLNDRRTPRSG